MTASADDERERRARSDGPPGIAGAVALRNGAGSPPPQFFKSLVIDTEVKPDLVDHHAANYLDNFLRRLARRRSWP